MDIKCIVNGTTLNSNIEVLELSEKYDNLYSAIGFHPSDINVLPDDYLEFLEDNKLLSLHKSFPLLVVFLHLVRSLRLLLD